MKVLKYIPLDPPQKNTVGFAWLESEKMEAYFCVKVVDGNYGKFPSFASFYIEDKFHNGFQFRKEETQKKFKKSITDALKAHFEEYGVTPFDQMPQEAF